MIRKIKWKSHNILSNLDLDFTKGDGGVFNTVIIVGENGTGKTTIFNTLCAFLNRGSILPFEYIEYQIGSETYKVYYDNIDNAKFGFHIREKLSDGSKIKIKSNSNNNANSIETDDEDIRKYGVVFSRARSGFHTNPVNNETKLQLDQTKYDIDNNEDFTSIKQLLVDIDGQDNSKLHEIVDEKGEISKEEYQKYKQASKMNRFETAFNNFFENIHYKKINHESTEEKEVIFCKNGKDILVDGLSTGEKQIVFRGTQLLRNVNAVAGGEFFIDEPELSMHPKWQRKILDYYMKLVEGENNQLIIATHSDYLLHEALNKKDVLVVALKNCDGEIKAHKITEPSISKSITFAEANYSIFGIPSNDYHIELYGYLQSKSGCERIEDCDRYIEKQTLYYDKSIHEMPSSFGTHTYKALPTYIRNAIDHPDNGNIFSEEQLITSIELLIKLCKKTNASK